MRRFHSYGPGDCQEHFCVPRTELFEQCMNQLIGNPEKGGHYFTIWAPRQTGKTWLMRQVTNKIRSDYPDRFIIAAMSCQGIIMKEDSSEDEFLKKIPKLMFDGFKIDTQQPGTWEEWILFFHRQKGLFQKPVILFIDEFDSLPPKVIDRIVTLFRDVYLTRNDYYLHGMALIGVRAVLGVESLRSSPFNVQRSLHVPNLTKEEVEDMFRQYQEESSQKIEPTVVEKVFDATLGQPGLVSWFGELLTEKYNHVKEKIIDTEDWENCYMQACTAEWNNTVLNLIKKAKGEYCAHILELFNHSDVLFSLDTDWCNYTYLNGIIDYETVTEPNGRKKNVCRFSSPFVQLRIYNALTYDLIGDRMPILSLEPLDDLSDVFDEKKEGIDIPALLERYKKYLLRMKAKGLNPWKDQPRRSDLHLTEYVGHFHLHSWLLNAIGRRCVVSPEFPTGNGKVDLHLRCGDKRGIIEVKSYTNASDVKDSKIQAAGYAKKMGIGFVTIAMFVPVEDENILKKISGQEIIDGITVTIVAIGWV